MMKQWTSEEIKNFRKQLGLYQKDFAELIGVTRVYVIYLEKEVRRPSKTMKKLLDLLEQQENDKEKGRCDSGRYGP
jgi:DNA-binding transcriptional regulator YiaG